MTTLWGIDLGGTKLEGVILDSSAIYESMPWKPLFRERIATEADRGYDHIVGQIERLLELMSQRSTLSIPNTIGIGTPGTFDPFIGAMKNCNTTALNGRNLPHDLESKLSSKIALANDANCFALAEATLGAAKGARSVFGVIMGTGVGGGIVIDGKVLNGAQGIAGEWGHNVLDPSGNRCYCGKKGCVETVLSGPALERYYQRLSGVERSLKDIAERAASGEDPGAKETIDRLCRYFGLALATIINILDPEVIVLGGGVGNIGALYSRGIDTLKEHIFNHRLDTRIVKPHLGDSAGVFGAAMLTAP